MSFLRRQPRARARPLPPPTQDHVPVREIRGSIVIRHDGALVAILGIQALNLPMLAPAEQLRVIAAYDQVIKALPFGWQTLIIARPQDVGAHLQALREQAAAHEQAGHLYHHQLLLNYIDFLNQLAWDSMALVRDYRIVVLYRHPGIDQVKEKLGGRRVLTTQLLEEGAAELDHRVQQLQHGLRSCGLDTWILSGPELKHELYLFYHPALQAEPLDLTPAPRVVRETVYQAT